MVDTWNPELRLVGRIIGWIMLVATVPVFATDALLWLESGHWAPLSAGEFWETLAPAAKISAHRAVQIYLDPYLWDPTVTTVLKLPAFLVLSGFGLLLMLLFAEPAARMPEREKAVAAVIGRVLGGALVVATLPVFVLSFLSRGIGWIVLAGSFVVLARDALLWAKWGHWTSLSLGKMWYDFAPFTMNSARVLFQSNVHPYLWDPIITTVLMLPVFLVMMGLGFTFILFSQRQANLEYKAEDEDYPVYQPATRVL